jgi:DNA-binding PadR family transcriptional regulator
VSTNLREVVLGLLLDRPAHAYAIKRLIAPRVSPSALINDGVLYPLLEKLAGDGLIRGREELSPSNRRRTVYSVTDKGKKEFMAWLKTEADEAEEPAYDFFMGHSLLVKIQFFKRLTPRERTKKLTSQLARTEQKLKDFEEIRVGMLERKADPFRIALLDLGMEHQKETRRWLQQRLRE